jgi:hypothetical protein
MYDAGGVNVHTPTWEFFRLPGNNDHPQFCLLWDPGSTVALTGG